MLEVKRSFQGQAAVLPVEADGQWGRLHPGAGGRALRPEGCGLGGWPHRAVGQQGACWVVGGLGVWPSSLLCSLQSSFAGAPAPSLQEGSDSGLSESEESVFSGLEDSGSDSSEDDPAEEEEEVSSDEGHSGQKTAGQQVSE